MNSRKQYDEKIEFQNGNFPLVFLPASPLVHKATRENSTQGTAKGLEAPAMFIPM